MPNPSIHAFAEKVAVVSGVDTPVGRAVAIQLALNGAFVTTVSEHASGGESVRGLLEIGSLSNHLTEDVTAVDGRDAVRQDLDSRFGRLDMLVDVRIIDGSRGFETDSGFAMKQSLGTLDPLVGLMAGRPSPKIVRVLITESIVPGREGSFREYLSGLIAELPSGFRANGVLVNASAPQLGTDGLLQTRSGVDADDVARIVIFFLSGESRAVNGQVLIA